MNNRQAVLWLCAFLLGPAVPVRAESVSSGAIVLSEVLRLARDNNPDILAARKESEMVRARVTAARSWPSPEVGAEWMGFSRSGLSVDSAEEKWYTVGQPVPFPGKLWLKGKAASHAAMRQEDVYLGMEREILARVKEAYFELLYRERAVRIARDSVDVMRRFARIAESRYGTGRVSQSDVLRAQTELSKTLNRLVSTEQEWETARARLNTLLDRDPDEPLSAAQEPVVAALSADFSAMEKVALEHRPEIRSARHHVTHMQSEIRAARAEFLPDAMVEYTWRERVGLEPDARAMVRFTLPFIWFWRQDSLLESARREKEHAEATLRSASAMTRYEVKEYVVHVQTSRRLIELYRTTILPQAGQSLKVAESAYQAGRVGFLDLLDSERSLIEAQLEYQRSLADYGINLAHLERAVGTDFLQVQ